MKKSNKIIILSLSTALAGCSFGLPFNNHVRVLASDAIYQENDADVMSIKTFKQDAGYAFSFFIPKSDYGTKEMIATSQSSWVYGSDLNFLDKISFNYKTSATFTKERFINVWNQNGAFTLRTTATAAEEHNFVTDIDTITVEQGCTFPNYDYTAGASSTPSLYKTMKTMVFVNDGEGNFSYDKHYGDYTKPDGYTCIDTNITLVNEKNGTEQLSFLQFVLSNSDYGSSFVDLGNKYATKLQELKFLDYIYVNGQKLSSDSNNRYNLQSILNFGTGSTYAIRTMGNNTGGYYKTGTKYINTDKDYTAYEVVVAAGCCFPSYAYLSGATETPTCYLNTKTTRFVWDGNKYVVFDNYNEPNRIANDVVSVSSHGSGSDVAIDFIMEKFDYPNSAGDCVLGSNLNNSYKITLTDKDGNAISISNERFANVWNRTGCFSIRKPSSLSWSDIKVVTIYTGCEFPAYDAYTNFDDSRYVTTETRKFYSNGDGTFYLSNEKKADEFAAEFLSETGTVCASTTIEDKETKFNQIYSSFASTYSLMPSEEKAKLVDGGTQVVQNMLARYDYIVNKYNIQNDFLKRKHSESALYEAKQANNLVIILSLGMVVVLSFSLIFIIRRKRRNSK